MQLTFDLQPGITQQYRTLREVVAAVVYQYRGGIGGVAAVIDQSPSELGRRLNHADGDAQRNLDIEDLVHIVEATDDYRPVLWLVEKFLPSDEQKRQAAIEQLPALISQFNSILAVVGSAALKKGKR